MKMKRLGWLEIGRQFLRSPIMRGRVHRISIVQGGELSVVLRFGVDEPRARELMKQGALCKVQIEDAPDKGTTFTGAK